MAHVLWYARITLAAFLWIALEILRAIVATYKKERPNTKKIRIFSTKGRDSVCRTGIGRIKMAISVAILPAAWTYHCGAMGRHVWLMSLSQKPETGQHWNIVKNNCDTPHTPTTARSTTLMLRMLLIGKMRIYCRRKQVFPATREAR